VAQIITAAHGLVILHGDPGIPSPDISISYNLFPQISPTVSLDCTLGHNWWTASALDIVHPKEKERMFLLYISSIRTIPPKHMYTPDNFTSELRVPESGVSRLLV